MHKFTFGSKVTVDALIQTLSEGLIFLPALKI